MKTKSFTMRQGNKYDYYKVIQQNYGQGFEDVSHYTTDSTFFPDKETRQLIKHDAAEYRLLGYPTRIVNKREAKEKVN